MAICPNCGEENPDRARLCMMCGTALGQAPKTQLEERKVVSVLFVDLVGFTARSHGADPEDVRAAQAPYHALLKTEIERFGGTVEKFIGDAVMAVFGAPIAHEDDAERAVRTALRIVEAIAELNDSSALGLSVRAAVYTGEGLVALGARPEAGEGMVTGDVVNTASRLQTAAPVNGVVVGEITYRSTRDLIDYQELEAVTVKGKPEPVAVWLALSAKSRFGVDADMAAKTPFIGRDYELDVLKGSFKRALRGSSIQLVTIVGEPGVGKSRLLSEFSSFIGKQQEFVFWRQGRSLPYGEGITFWALGEIVKAHAGILESDSSDQASGKLREAVTVVIKDSSEQQWFLSRLAPLVGVEASGNMIPHKEESFTAWRRFLEAVAETGPLVVVFEDLHWADPSLLEFIEHVVDWVIGVPIFVVCTSRPELYENYPGWGGGKRNFNILALSPLDDSETAQLISSLLSQAILPSEIHASLLERAGGNPLYAEEFIRMLSDRGILKHKGRVVSLDKDVDIPVPESVQALIAARLDTLAPERKSLLHNASVVGKVFWSGAVAAIGAIDDELVRQDLHKLETKELVRSSRTSSIQGEQQYSFWHALVRDVCYSQIPRAVRASKHLAAAKWIQEAAERLDDNAEVLAYHFSTAMELITASGGPDVDELASQTSRFLMLAADRAINFAPTKALALYRQALELLDLNDPERPKVLGDAGKAASLLGLSLEGQRYFEQAIAAFSARQDFAGEATALRGLADVLRDRGRSDQSRRAVERAVELLERQPPGEALSLAYTDLAFFEVLTGSPSTALAWAQRAVNIADTGADGAGSVTLAQAMELRGVARCELGDIDGLQDLREAISISEKVDDAAMTASAIINLGDRIWLIEGPQQGLEFFKRAQEIANAHGSVTQATEAEAVTLSMLFELGRWDEVLEQAETTSSWLEERNISRIESWIALPAAQVLFYRGDADKALLLGQNLLPILQQMGELDSLLPCLVFMSLVHAHSEAKSALTLIRDFEQRTRRTPLLRARYLPDVMRALVAMADTEAISTFLLTEDDVVFARDRHAVVTAHAIVAEARGELKQALQLYNDAARRWNSYGFPLEEGQALLGAGRCLIALGSRSEASIKLQDARRTFEELGAPLLLGETDGYLQQATAATS